MVLVLIPNGKSNLDINNKFTGLIDSELSTEGEKEILTYLEALKDIKLDICFTSNLIRCITTATILNTHLTNKFKIYTSTQLNERDYKNLSGMDKMNIDNDNINIENMNNIIKRVGEYYETKIKPKIINNNILIISHQDTLKALIIYLTNININNNIEFPYIIEYNSN